MDFDSSRLSNNTEETSQFEDVSATAVSMFAYNISTNSSNGSLNAIPEKYIAVTATLRTVCLPLIAIVGFLGNTLSILVFTTRHMRSSPCSVFLAALAVVDNVFLFSIIINWVDGSFYNILTSESKCTALVYISYITSFLSVWFIVGFTCERYFAICFPLRSNFLCSVFREKMSVILMSAVGIVLYSYSLWTTSVTYWKGSYRCYPKGEFMKLLNIFTWVDTLLTMVIPFFLISAMNTKVLCTIVRSFSIIPSSQSPMKTTQKQNTDSVHCARGRRYPTLRVTRTMLLVSTTFLFLNLPSHIIRLHSLIVSTASTQSSGILSWKYMFVQEIAQLLYYSTFSCNFILYTLSGRNFKDSLMMMLRCKSQVETNRSRMLIRLSSTHALMPVTSV